jgi:hypothetical protein
MTAIDLTAQTATQTDAQTLIQLAQLAQSSPFDQGMAILHHGGTPMTYDEFGAQCPPGSDERSAVMSVLRWYELVGTLVKNGLLDRALTYDWLYVAGVWDKAAAIALGQRAESVPAMWENFEALAEGQRA